MTRIAVALVLVVFLAGTHWKAYVSGRQALAAQYQAQALAASEAARRKEQTLSARVQELDHALQQQKTRNARLDRALADRVREYQEAVGRAAQDAAAADGVASPFAAIAGQCGAALAAMDAHARELARIAEGLQGYTRQVCLAK